MNIKQVIYSLAIAIGLANVQYLKATDQTDSLPRFKDRKTQNSGSSLIQIAILLDTSGSMQGLVDQARMQIWNVVNEMAAASRNGKKSEVQVAVFQYGSSQANRTSGYIKRVLDFSDDLDEVSRALFSLTVKGGVEFCGETIRQACDDLSWSESAGYRAIFIAGNEAFDQGETSFASVLPRISEKSIRVNTIYCQWKDAKKQEEQLWSYAARLADGSYSMINHNRKMTSTITPYDGKFRELNKRMNESFIWYGKDAKKHMRNQISQDENAKRMSNSAFAARMSSKIGHLYKHVHSDLVDAVHHGHLKIEDMPREKMPESLRDMSVEQRTKYVNRKIAEREKVRRDMATVIAQRQGWIQEQARTKSDGQSDDTWGQAALTAVRSQLKEAGFDSSSASN